MQHFKVNHFSFIKMGTDLEIEIDLKTETKLFYLYLNELKNDPAMTRSKIVNKNYRVSRAYFV